MTSCLLLLFFMLSRSKSAVGLGLSLSLDKHFQQWYPQFLEEFESIMRNNCSNEYQRYTQSSASSQHPEAIASKVVACIYKSNTLDDAIKSNFASATVLLGLLPTILSTIGSNAAEASMLALRRPILALLLALGSPAPSPTRAFEYQDPHEVLQDTPENVHLPTTTSMTRKIIAFGQLLLAVGCAINIIELGLELGFRTVSSWAPSRVWTVSLWSSLGVVVHLFACICLRLRVSVKTERLQEPGGWRSWVSARSWRSRLWRVVRDEFTPCAAHSPTELRVKGKSRWFVFWSWLTSVVTALHIIFGTLTFSGLMFISVQDSAIVVARFFGSAVICRALLMYELNGMRQASKDIRPTRQGPQDKTSSIELGQFSQSMRSKSGFSENPGGSEVGLLEHTSV